jgi:GNAT superfamily N-acetyltransferase
MSLKVYQARKGKSAICEKIIRQLPEWFGVEKAIREYIKGVADYPMFLCAVGSEIVGFISIKKHNKYTAEIYVMGVIKERHRSGVGKRLIEAVQKYLKTKKFEFLTVKTLSPTVTYKPYQKTRKFYEAMSFRPIEDFGEKIWGKGNPCLLLAKSLL